MNIAGKKIAILGDSISTYDGYNPEGYLVYYQGQKALDANVLSVEDTWWERVLRYFNAELICNNSYSGSRVCGGGFPTGSGDERIDALAVNGVPDVIIVYLGTNDYWGGEPLHGDGVAFFDGAYEIMLQKLRARYPGAEVICTAGGCGACKSSEPSVLAGGDENRNFSMFNSVIRALAEKYRCSLVDLENDCVVYDSVDGVHPTALGMKQIAQTFIDTLCKLGTY